MFDIVPKTVNITTGKKNLAQISKVLCQITSGTEFGDAKPSYVPMNEFVRKAITPFSEWLIQGSLEKYREVLRLIFHLQLQMSLMLRTIFMLMNSWMPLYSPSPYIYLPMKFIPCIHCWYNIRIFW